MRRNSSGNFYKQDEISLKIHVHDLLLSFRVIKRNEDIRAEGKHEKREENENESE
jgi:hypothetical protein